MPATTSHPPPRNTRRSRLAGGSVCAAPTVPKAPHCPQTPPASGPLQSPGKSESAVNSAPIRRSGDHERRRCRRPPPRRRALTGKASRPIPRYVAGPCLPCSTFAAACHVRVTPRPSPAASARQERTPRRSLTCGNATDRHRGTPSHPPGGSLTIDCRSPANRSPARRGGSRRWACPLSARRRPPRRDAVPRKPGHHQSLPLARRLVPIPGVNGALVAVAPHGHPTGPSRVGRWRAHDHATTLGERPAEGVRASTHPPAAMTASVTHARTDVRACVITSQGPSRSPAPVRPFGL